MNQTSTSPSAPSPSQASIALSLARDAVALKPEPYQNMVSGKPSIRRGVLIVLAVGLFIGVVQAFISLPALFRAPVALTEADIAEIEQSLDMMRQFGSPPTPEMEQLFDIYVQMLGGMIPLIQQISELPTPLPPFFNRLFIWLGGWLSSPFALLAKWLGLAIWIMLFARLLGGRGTLMAYLNASALTVIPHLLTAFAFIPCFGGLLALLGSIWGLVMHVKVVETSHQLTRGRAVLAVLSPYIAFLLLMGFLTALFTALIFFSILSSPS
ncbi:MAG: YIP1 family protein [Chloroflexi bacterium]|nr:YIP1 family protein [Chloroflexota bacterium]